MLSKNMSDVRRWGTLVFICIAACWTIACSSGVKCTPFAITDQDRSLIAGMADTASLLDYIEEFSTRSQTRTKKNELLRLSHYVYRSAADEQPTQRQRAALVLARSAFLVADIEADAQKQAEIADTGARAALEAGATARSPEASYYYALNLGLVMRHKGLAALAKLDDLKKALDHCQNQATLDFGGPRRVLGMLYLKAPAWPQGIGDIDAALELLQAVVQEYPDFPQNRMFYAEAVYADGLIDEARDQLKKAADGLVPEKWGSDYVLIWKKEIDTLLATFNP